MSRSVKIITALLCLLAIEFTQPSDPAKTEEMFPWVS